jgi:hypothetical protein
MHIYGLNARRVGFFAGATGSLTAICCFVSRIRNMKLSHTSITPAVTNVQFFQQLAVVGAITQAEALAAAVGRVATPTVLRRAIAAIEDQQNGSPRKCIWSAPPRFSARTRRWTRSALCYA